MIGHFSNHLWVPEQVGAFSVVVPNLLQGAELVMFASPNERPEIPRPAGIGGPADRAASASRKDTIRGGYARAGLIMGVLNGSVLGVTKIVDHGPNPVHYRAHVRGIYRGRDAAVGGRRAGLR